MEDLEEGMREAALRDGSRMLSALLSQIPDSDKQVLCPVCQQQAYRDGTRTKQLISLLGEGSVSRTYYSCRQPGCPGHCFPKDEYLDINDTSFSPGLRRLMARLGSHDSFEAGSQDLKAYGGIEVDAKDIERVSEAIGTEIVQQEATERPVYLNQQPSPPIDACIPILYVECDGTGVPMAFRELAGRKGKQEDGTAKTREAKLGCVFTQLTTDQQGRPIRQPESTTYVGSIETSVQFGERLSAEAVRRGLWQSNQVIFLGDGARWVWTIADQKFFGATQIVDIYHASEHLHKLLSLLTSSEDALNQQWAIWHDWMQNGQIQRIIDQALLLLPKYAQTEQGRRIEQEIGYFKDNINRMRYDVYKKLGLFVGSGVIEAGCKTVIGKRLKQSGMHWSLRGANAIIALRCYEASNRFDEFWEKRAA